MAVDQILEHGADGVALGLDLSLAADLRPQCRGMRTAVTRAPGRWQNST